MLDGKSVMKVFRSFIPPLLCTSHKGQCGRIGIIGGSKEKQLMLNDGQLPIAAISIYTGAPYFAGISALLTGADLVHVICPNEAASAIKSYSPELIVHPILNLSAEESFPVIDRLHAVVLGPGLGREENISNAEKIVHYCRDRKKPLVIDADGLYVVTAKPDLIRNYEQLVLTPNIVEFDRLYRRMFGEDCSPSDSPEETVKLSKELGNVTIVRKGSADAISDANHSLLCTHEGSPRRCGGQGDLLSGSMGVFLYWGLKETWKEPYSATLAAAYAACCLTRQCANTAFGKFGRATITGNLIDEIRSSFPLTFDA